MQNTSGITIKSGGTLLLGGFISASFTGTWFDINSTSGGFTSVRNGSTFTYTAILEPSTYVAALGLLGMLIWPIRCRLVRDARNILGLRAPMRDRRAARQQEVCAACRLCPPFAWSVSLHRLLTPAVRHEFRLSLPPWPPDGTRSPRRLLSARLAASREARGSPSHFFRTRFLQRGKGRETRLRIYSDCPTNNFRQSSRSTRCSRGHRGSK